MRNFLTLGLMSFCLNASFASVTVVTPILKASEIFIQVSKSGRTISLPELSDIKIRDFESLSGKKMKFFERLGFKAAQKKIREHISKDGTFTDKKWIKAIPKEDKEAKGSFGAFLIGLILGPFGVLIAYTTKGDTKKNMVKWAWIGFATQIALLLLYISLSLG